MRDPRLRVQTENLRCVREIPGISAHWAIGSNDVYPLPVADWPEVVAFATAILAADAEWREANAPTFAALREKHVDRNFWLLPHNCANDCVMTDISGEQRSHASMGHALEWLAAKLAETEEQCEPSK